MGYQSAGRVQKALHRLRRKTRGLRTSGSPGPALAFATDGMPFGAATVTQFAVVLSGRHRGLTKRCNEALQIDELS